MREPMRPRRLTCPDARARAGNFPLRRMEPSSQFHHDVMSHTDTSSHTAMRCRNAQRDRPAPLQPSPTWSANRRIGVVTRATTQASGEKSDWMRNRVRQRRISLHCIAHKFRNIALERQISTKMSYHLLMALKRNNTRFNRTSMVVSPVLS